MHAELRNFQRLLLADRARGDNTPAAIAYYALKQSITEYRKSVASGTPCPPSAFNTAAAANEAALPAPVAPVVPAAPAAVTPGVEVAINNLAQRFDAFQDTMVSILRPRCLGAADMPQLQLMNRLAPPPPPSPPGPSA